MDDDDRLQRIRGELEQLVARRLRRPLNVAERDRWRELVVVELALLERHLRTVRSGAPAPS